MEKVKLGKSDIEVSGLCLGTDSIGSKINQKTSFQIMDLYQERGGELHRYREFLCQLAAWLSRR